jgi:exopolyphosphatase/guanosine-5'-triphosphate,3'-diphosphate pyrophosphatase
MRLLIVNIVEQEGNHSLIKVRWYVFPSFGSRCFTVGEISDENLDRMCDAMKAFNLLMKVHKVERYMALPPRQCAKPTMVKK